MNPEQLLDLADREANPEGMGAPRQVVLRRAVSSAYYGVFHQLLWTVAGEFVGGNTSKAWVLFYRALDHGKARDRCKRLGSNPLPNEESAFFKIKSFSDELRSFANAFVRLQELRTKCDYDPEFRIAKGEAQQLVEDARKANKSLEAAKHDEKSLFLAYLLFGLRR